MTSAAIVPSRRVLVLWADGESPNLGVQVLGMGAVAIARSVWGRGTHVNLQDFAGTQTGVPMGIRAIIKEFVFRKRQIRDFIASHDVILDTGAGDSFTDIYGYKRMLTIFVIQQWSFRLGVPVIMLPQTIGPFTSRLSRYLAKRQLRMVGCVMTRDPKSAAVSAELGREPELTSSDLVFALPPVPRFEKFDVLFNISGLLWNPNRHVDSDRYRAAVHSFVHGMKAQGREVTLFAHVVNGGENDDDLAAIREFAASSSQDASIAVPGSLEEARQMIAGSKVVVGARMHACLNALSLGVPTLPWAYSRKFEPLLGHLGWTHFVDLRDDGDAAMESIRLLTNSDSDELNILAEAVALAGRSALALTADGIRDYSA